MAAATVHVVECLISRATSYFGRAELLNARVTGGGRTQACKNVPSHFIRSWRGESNTSECKGNSYFCAFVALLTGLFMIAPPVLELHFLDGDRFSVASSHSSFPPQFSFAL